MARFVPVLFQTNDEGIRELEPLAERGLDLSGQMVKRLKCNVGYPNSSMLTCGSHAEMRKPQVKSH